MKKIDKTNASFANLIMTNSVYTKQNIKNAYQKNAIVCYPSVDSDFFKPVGVSNKNNILFVGDEDQLLKKGFKKTLEGVLQGKYRIEKLVRNRNNDDRYLRELYNRALVTVCLTQNEPFGMVPLESMSCGTPVIALDDGGYKETIVEGKTGFLVGKSIKEIENKINYFVLNPSRSNIMGNFGRNHVKSKFTWEKHLRILNEAIKS